ncbi:MAG: hypothetical protein GX950_02155 [Candidatus Diapherotrites archaeon]|jgi:hypothetical protein|uniref:Uncharacterized protein n=1 Tax=Candidatus Iainarchaeum sp. TaxID=3101447 RepID=A0A7K4BZA7_9ARCH|nr:hypothetical protein [Candidatus Diapherotrites archaeon]
MRKRVPIKSVLAGNAGSKTAKNSTRRDFKKLQNLLRTQAIKKGVNQGMRNKELVVMLGANPDFVRRKKAELVKSGQLRGKSKAKSTLSKTAKIEIIKDRYLKGWSVHKIAKEIGMSVPFVHQCRAQIVNKNPELLKERLSVLNKVIKQLKTNKPKPGKEIHNLRGALVEKATIERMMALEAESKGSGKYELRKNAHERAARLKKKKVKEDLSGVSELMSQNIISKIKKVNPQLSYIIPSREGLKLADKRIQELSKELQEAKRTLSSYTSTATEKYYARDKEIRANSSLQTLILFTRGGLKEHQSIELLLELGKKQKE